MHGVRNGGERCAHSSVVLLTGSADHRKNTDGRLRPGACMGSASQLWSHECGRLSPSRAHVHLLCCVTRVTSLTLSHGETTGRTNLDFRL